MVNLLFIDLKVFCQVIVADDGGESVDQSIMNF